MLKVLLLFLFGLGWKIAWSSITMSWLFVSYVVFTSSSESGGSVCLCFNFGCLSLILGSVVVNGDSVSWDIGCVFTGVDGDIYYRILGCWLISCSWLLGSDSCGVTLCSSRLTLIISIMLRFMILICRAIILFKKLDYSIPFDINKVSGRILDFTNTAQATLASRQMTPTPLYH